MNVRMRELENQFYGMVKVEELQNATWQGRHIMVVRLHNTWDGVRDPKQVLTKGSARQTSPC
eukprot:1699160-Pyramimonas_sp.AAC.1